MNGSPQYNKRSPEATEAWILGSGTASLASAVYLITKAKLRPSAVHILDEHLSFQDVVHRQGSAHAGYDQFAECLPVPIGPDLKELLNTIPSVIVEEQSFLDDIKQQEIRLSMDKKGRTCFITQKDGCFKHLPTKSLNLGLSHKIHLIRLLMKKEKSLQRKKIQEFFPKSFFDSSFWIIWSMQ